MQKALIVLDLIQDISQVGGKIASSAKMIEDNRIIDGVNLALDFARRNDWLVVFVKVGFDDEYKLLPTKSPFFSKLKSINALKLSSNGCNFHQDLKVSPSDIVVIKHRISGFYATDLELILRTNGITQTYICGASTTWAISATSRDAHDRDFEVFILKDLCADHSNEAHLAQIATLSSIATIVELRDLLD
jgi:ureidoacrylate peracid hydrolase